jgi:pyruvate formate lyase activating enzyme
MTEPGLLRGTIFDIQRFSVHDGPGIRTTVFLKGCPLRCAWCHNPESQSAQPEIVVIESRCIHCGTCGEVCPRRNGVADGDVCTLCGRCVAACPTGARQQVGREVGVAELAAVVLRDHIFYDESGGGVTFSGGEPLLQYDFLRAALEAVQAEGIHTAVDTCGFGVTEQLLDIAHMADLFLFDLKLWDADRHTSYTGVSNARIIENLQALSATHGNIWIRVPIIPGINDDADNIEAIAGFAASLPGVRQVSLLPFHRTGIGKYARLGKAFDLTDVETPTNQQMERLAHAFTQHGLVTRIGEGGANCMSSWGGGANCNVGK